MSRRSDGSRLRALAVLWSVAPMAIAATLLLGTGRRAPAQPAAVATASFTPTRPALPDRLAAPVPEPPAGRRPGTAGS